MEKRLLMAFVLSFVIMYLWSGIFFKKTINESQVIDNKQITSESISAEIKSVDLPAQEQPKAILNESLFVLSNDGLELSFSSAGGYLKSVKLKNYDYVFPVTNVLKLDEYGAKEYVILRSSDEEVVYQYKSSDIRITKSYKLKTSEFLESKILFENLNGASKVINIAPSSLALEMSKLDINFYDKTNYEYVVYLNKDYVRKNNAFKFEAKEKKNILGSVDWTAFRDRYFCLIVKPVYKTTSYSLNPISDKQMDINLESKGVELSAGGSISFDYQIFAGPEKIDLLNKYDKDFSKIKMFYRFGLFDLIAHLLYKSMHFMYKIVPNWGLNIVLICIFIYLLMYPLTIASMSSMKRMQQLQPKMAEIKEKYKNNQQKQSVELMLLYKENKINPLSGCLPMLLQMPFFIGIYQVLWRDVSFKGEGFLWIKDLTLPDRFFILPFNIPFVGNEFNLLPIAYALAMYFQQKFSMKSMVSMDSSQAEVQKLMVIFMPIMLAVLFYKFPSGTTLYFTVYFLLTAVNQWKISKS